MLVLVGQRGVRQCSAVLVVPGYFQMMEIANKRQKLCRIEIKLNMWGGEGEGGMQLTRPLSHGTVYYKTLSRELQWSPPNLGMFMGCSSSLRVWRLTSTHLTLSTRHFYPLQCDWTLQTSHNIYPRPGWHNGANGDHTEHSALSHPAWDNWQWGDSLNGSLKWVLHSPPVLNFSLASRAQDNRGVWRRLSCACSTL